MNLVGDFFNVLNWVSLAIALVGVFAFVDAAIRPSAAFVAAGKLTKPAWMAIVGISALVLFLFGFMTLFGLPAVVAVLVYLVDVRPAVRNVAGGSSGSVGPYGPW